MEERNDTVERTFSLIQRFIFIFLMDHDFEKDLDLTIVRFCYLVLEGCKVFPTPTRLIYKNPDYSDSWVREQLFTFQ